MFCFSQSRSARHKNIQIHISYGMLSDVFRQIEFFTSAAKVVVLAAIHPSDVGFLSLTRLNVTPLSLSCLKMYHFLEVLLASPHCSENTVSAYILLVPARPLECNFFLFIRRGRNCYDYISK